MAAIGITDKKFISAVDLLDQREILESVIDIHNDAGLTDVLNIASRRKPTKQPVYHNFVDEALFTLGDTTGATVTGSGTATIGTTLTAETSGIAREGDLVLFPTGSKVGYISEITTASSQDSLTIKSVDGTNITHTAAQKLAFFSSASGEKSGAPSNRKFVPTKYLNKVQIFREVNEVTDVQSMSTVEVSYNGSNYVVVKQLVEKALLLKAKINAAFIGGKMSTTSFEDATPSLTDPGNGGAVQTTRGLYDYVTTYGVSDTVASTGTWALSDQEDLISQLLAKKSPKKYMALYATKPKIKIDNHLKNLGSGGVTSGRLSVDGQSLNLEAESFKYGGFEFQYSCLPILDHPDLFSQSDISKSIFYIPVGKVKTKGGGEEPYIQTRYMDVPVKGASVGNGLVKEWHSGALAPTGATNDDLYWRTNWVSCQGLEVLGAQHMAVQKVIA
jgi:hypothetical protein